MRAITRPLLAAVICMTIVAAPSPAAAVVEYRADGANRYDTARIMSGALNECTVALANGENFPDGLTGAVFGVPVLLTRTDSVPPETVSELERLDDQCAGGLDEIIVLGGAAAVSASVFQQLAIDYAPGELVRLSGADRYGTALAIAEHVHVTEGINDNTVFLATGADFPDALAAGSPSGALRHPILLNDGDELMPGVGAFLQNRNIDRVLILGGAAAVPPTVEDQLQLVGIATDRFAGADRVGTAVAIAEGFYVSPACALLVNSNAFADALAAAPFGTWQGCPIVLVNRDSVPPATTGWLEAGAPFEFIIAIGGGGVISNDTFDAAIAAATP